MREPTRTPPPGARVGVRDSVAPMAVTTSSADAVQLTIPLRSEYGSILRLVAASFGADAAFFLDDIDDLRLAVSEVFSSALQHGATAATLTAVFNSAASGVQVSLSVSTDGGSPGVIELDELASAIIKASVDRVEVDEFSVRLTKHSSELAPATTDDD